jgi:hypothetical protein
LTDWAEASGTGPRAIAYKLGNWFASQSHQSCRRCNVAHRAHVNLLQGEVIDTIYLGNFLECRVRVGHYEVSVQMDHYEHLVPRQKVFLSFQPDHGLCLTG